MTPRRAVTVAPVDARPPLAGQPRVARGTTVAPLSRSRSTVTWSSQSYVASVRIRSATGANDGVTVASPAISLTRPASVSASAARIMILLGTQP